ncbi:MAG: SDR family oxidoreductase, partial [Saprospiraceae bacterium]|nr:SDR family oxidoreductase [Saprospiraceae bacterium]
MATLRGKTAFITGASRGIGKAIALRLARDGVNIVVAAKTIEPHPKLEGTIYTAVEEIDRSGGQGLAVQMDVRFEDQVKHAVDQAVDHFGGIDILVNNASAIQLTPVEFTEMKRYDLMHQVNVRGTFLSSRLCLPYLKESKHAHILNMAPPLTLDKKWYSSHLAYTMTKMGMSMCVLGMSEEFKPRDIAVNALWPQTTIATAAVK